jgi:KUP system potassium uptake protein
MAAPLTRAQRAAAISLPRLPPERRDRAAAWKLAIPALGVVYGDIGTSPLYAMKECFSGEHRVDPSTANVFGILSLIVWSLTLVVSLKYLTFIMRADNGGEGGILALLALVPRKPRPSGAAKGGGPGFLVLLVLFGAALLYGDGVITPAISVLSAVEGLGVATKALEPAVVPLTVVTLLALFMAQKRGTAGVGKVFGPVMLVWFFVIGALGAVQLAKNPGILRAVDPRYAVAFFVHNGGHGFLVLGGVVLVITGAEALYADMGHFGAGPIRRSWFVMVFPALLLNYFGQGAALLGHAERADNPFYAIVPGWALYPSVVISTAATVVASQALISGAYSLTQQAVQLGFFPRVTIVHTSQHTEGQIYVPEINWTLAVACIGLVLGFKSSNALASAYGVAVTGTMAITSITYAVVAHQRWRWPLWKIVPLASLFLAIDLAYFSACATKVVDGGWFPLLLGALIYTVMTTWNTGRRYLGLRIPRRPRGAAPAAREGDRGLHGRQRRRRSARAPAPLQAQPEPSRDRRAPARRRPPRPGRPARRPRVRRAPRARVLPGHALVRLHGGPERAHRPRGVRAVRPRHPSGQHQLLPRARDPAPHRQLAHVALAQGALRVHLPQRRARHRVLRPSARARRGARHADRPLNPGDDGTPAPREVSGRVFFATRGPDVG